MHLGPLTFKNCDFDFQIKKKQFSPLNTKGCKIAEKTSRVSKEGAIIAIF